MKDKGIFVMLLPCLILGAAGFFMARREAVQEAELARQRAEQAKMQQTLQKQLASIPNGLALRKSGLIVTEIVLGTGATAVNGKTLVVHYSGLLTNGTKFDSSWNSGTPFSFVLGAGQVIAGWDNGLVGMKVGGKRRLIIPPAMAYGATGSPPSVPPNATLIFDVQLLNVQ